MEALGPIFHHHHYRPLFTAFTIIPASLTSLSKYSLLISLSKPPDSFNRRTTTASIISIKTMAQKREKEETELKVPETLTLCTPSITATSKISGSDEHRSSPERSDLKSGVAVDSRSSSGCSPKRPDLHQKPRLETAELPEDDGNRLKRRVVNRCSGCRRKVGLMGFRCRCGEMFCSDHRYSDRHDCSYDYKAAGREAIARENPVVRAAKILKV